jgi:hypothetical protein
MQREKLSRESQFDLADLDSAKEAEENTEAQIDLKKEKKKKKKKKEGYTIKSNVYFAICWISLSVLFLYYLYSIVSLLVQSNAVPSSTVQFSQETVLFLPAVTICNWNQVIGYSAYLSLRKLTPMRLVNTVKSK